MTDDPGTPGNGHWETNIAWQSAMSKDAKVFQFPLFDLNYGYGEHLQLNLNTSLITVIPSSENGTTGLSVASAALKWRFLDEELFHLSVSTYPRIDFHHVLSKDDPRVNPPGNRYFLPVEISKTFDPFAINPEIGFASYTQAPSEWVYGIALSYSLEKERELLFEIHGRSVMGSSDQELLYNLGTRYLLSENTSLLATVGRTFVVYSEEPMSWDVYLGIQIRK